MTASAAPFVPGAPIAGRKPMIRQSALVLALAVAACAPEPPPPTLPPELGGSQALITRDPTMVVGQSIVSFFRRPQPNQPAEAARAIAELEWLAETLPRSPRWQTASATGLTELQQARRQARTALGVAPGASSQAVIDGLAGAAQAIETNDQAALSRALPRTVFPIGPQAVVQRLAGPPSVPSVMPAFWALSTGQWSEPRRNR